MQNQARSNDADKPAIAASTLLARRGQRRSLSAFTRRVFEHVCPGEEYRHNWHIDLICEYLEACSRREITRLIINIPPRYMKSIATSVAWPAWALGHNPSEQVMASSYSASLSVKHSLDCRSVMESPWYKLLFPETILAPDQNQKQEFQTTAKGTRTATSVGGTATGKGGNILLVDDLHSAEGAASDAERETAIRWFDQTFSTRLNDKKTGVIVVIGQRLHERDITGHLLEQGGWEHLCIPAVAESPTRYAFGRFTKERKAGDLLHEEREGKKEIAQARLRLGSAFAGQYQQQPVSPEGETVKRGWWKFYTAVPQFDEMILSWDCTFKETDDGSYVVGQVWGRAGARKYLLDQTRFRGDFPATCGAIRMQRAKWPTAYLTLVEERANGAAVIATLQNTLGGIVPVNPEGGKVARLNAVSANIEAGNVYLPDPTIAPWVGDFVDEFSAFPKGKHDDQVDACTQALSRLRQNETAVGMFCESKVDEGRGAEVTMDDVLGENEKSIFGGRN